MAPKLDELPLVVQSLIYEQIYASSPETLRKLTLVNKTCYNNAIPFLYRRLSLKIRSRRTLHIQCAELEESLLCRHFLQNTRYLKISGRVYLVGEDGESAEFLERQNEEEGKEEGEEEDQEYRAEFDGVFGADVLEGTPEQVAEAWRPLALLIPKFQHLAGFFWVSWNQMPPNVLKELEQHHPFCRLHMRSFRLRSLLGVGDPTVPNTHERDLITSPLLHSITLRIVEGRDSDFKPDCNGKVIFQIASVAPNLKHIGIITCLTAQSPALIQGLRHGVNPWAHVSWKGFVPPMDISRKGTLTSLTYPMFGEPSLLDHLQQCANHVHMSRLRYLMLQKVTDSRVIRYLTHNVNLDSLEMLDIGSEDSVGLHALLEKLQPLKDLRLAGSVVPSLLSKILHRHGPVLRRLTLGSELVSQDIARIQSSCPLLEYAKYKIPKSVSEDLKKCKLGDICPDLHWLSELVLETKSDTDLYEKVRKAWNLISNKKKGSRLSCLYLVYDLRAVRVYRTHFDNFDEVSIEDVDWDGDTFDMRMMHQFHGLPAAEFRAQHLYER